MFWQLVTIEETKLRKRAMLWVELGLMTLAVLAANIALFAALQAGDLPENAGAQGGMSLEAFLTWPQGLIGALNMAAGSNLGGILLIVLVGAVTAQAYSWRTLPLWLGRGVPRHALLAARFAVFLLPILLLTLTPLLVGGAITALFSQQLLGHIPFDQVNWGEVGLALVRTAYTLLPYAALTFFLAVLSRSTATAVAGGVAYSLLGEGIAVQLLNLVGGIWAKIGQYLPAGLAQSLLGLNAQMVSVGNTDLAAPPLLEPGTAAWLIALYTLIFFTAALLSFRRQDLN